MGSAQNRVSLAEAEEETTTSSSSSSSSSNSKPGVCNPVPLSGPVTLTEVGLALRETQEQREARIRRLFDFFDVSHGGHLSRSDIERGFRGFSIPLEDEYAKDLMDACDADKDGAVDLGEFRKYVDEKELELYRIFREIDVEHYGCIMAEELRIALLRAGINVNDEELMSFVDHVDKDNNGIITFEEWRDFLLLYPHAATITNIYQYWEKVCLVDIGEQAVIPEGISWKLHATKFFIAGGVAGAVSRTATAPLDRLKVMLQVQTHTKPGTPHTIPAILQIYKEGGPLGFFRGNGINVLKVAPESAIKFYAYDMMKRLVISMDADEEGNGAIGPLGKLFAGGTAGAIAQTVIYPMDLVKTRLQTFACSSERAPSIGRLSRDIWIREGPLTFYRGLLPSLLGMIPYAGIDLAAYETLKDASLRFLPEENNEPGPLVQLVCGMVSGSLGATCVYPLQLVRTRLQAQDSKAPDRYMGMVDVFQRTWKNEGVRAFYKGLMPNLLKVIPAASITYIVYEQMKKRLSI